MKLSFYLLIFANLVLIIWHIGFQTPVESTPNIEPKHQAVVAANLILLRERGQQPGQSDHKQSNGVSHPEAVTEEWSFDEKESSTPQTQKDDSSRSGYFCHTIGPITDLQQAQEIASVLKSLGIEPKRRGDTKDQQIGYHVILPPQKDMALAGRKVESLHKDGHTKARLLMGGDLRGAISLGEYLQRQAARKRKTALLKLGIDAVVEPNYLEIITYWLDFDTKHKFNIPSDVWQALRGQYAKLKISTAPCGTGAIKK